MGFSQSVTGLLLGAVRLLCLALFPSKTVLIISQMLHSLTFGIFHPAAIAFVVVHVPPEKRAGGMTVYMSLGTGFPTFLGNIADGIIIEHTGDTGRFSAVSSSLRSSPCFCMDSSGGTYAEGLAGKRQ